MVLTWAQLIRRRSTMHSPYSASAMFAATRQIGGGSFLLLLTIVAGCASTEMGRCGGGETPSVTETLYFGTAKPGGIVSQEEWTAFVNEAVTPRFPEGLTSWAASGQWRMANGRIEHEASHLLQLTHDGSERREQAVRQIMERYKKDFQQEAVLRVKSRTCISF